MFDETQENDEQSFSDALTTPYILRDKVERPLTTQSVQPYSAAMTITPHHYRQI
jgi:hypothetical protein